MSEGWCRVTALEAAWKPFCVGRLRNHLCLSSLYTFSAVPARMSLLCFHQSGICAKNESWQHKVDLIHFTSYLVELFKPIYISKTLY